jgi:hypothetical protein
MWAEKQALLRAMAGLQGRHTHTERDSDGAKQHQDAHHLTVESELRLRIATIEQELCADKQVPRITTILMQSPQISMHASHAYIIYRVEAPHTMYIYLVIDTKHNIPRYIIIIYLLSTLKIVIEEGGGLLRRLKR